MMISTPKPPEITAANEKFRLFFAIPTPPYFQRFLQDRQTDFSGDWRPVHPTQFHITLAFLGEVSSLDLPKVTAAGFQAAEGLAEFPADFADLTAFPNVQKPRVGVARIVSPGMDTLARRLREALRGLPCDSRPFQAHLTLVRSRGGWVSVPTRTLSRTWTISEFHLFHSILSPQGPRHFILTTYPLATPPQKPSGKTEVLI
jgi:2'-5' RNA ligase